MKKSIGFLFLFGALLAISAGEPTQETKPAVAGKVDADCPRGECCLWRLALVGSGRLEHRLEKPHNFPTGETAQGSGFFELKPLKSAGLPCDEKHMLIPEGSQLNAAIHSIHRKDDLTHVCGTFNISLQGKSIFEGEIELLHRVNTHYRPFGTDPCDAKQHLQGWLTGKGTDNSRAKGYLLRAMLVARTDPLQGGAKGYAVGDAHLNGVIIHCKQ
jgi:hypothetical protein